MVIIRSLHLINLPAFLYISAWTRDDPWFLNTAGSGRLREGSIIFPRNKH